MLKGSYKAQYINRTNADLMEGLRRGFTVVQDGIAVSRSFLYITLAEFFTGRRAQALTCGNPTPLLSHSAHTIRTGTPSCVGSAGTESARHEVLCERRDSM
jgi:hypothetical protein